MSRGTRHLQHSFLLVKGIGQTQRRVEAKKCTLGIINNNRVVSIDAYGWKDFMSKVKRIPIETVTDIKTASTLPPPVLDKVSLLIGQDKALNFLLNSNLTELPSGHKLIDIGIGKFVCGQGQLKELKKTVKTFATVLQHLENRHDQDLTEKIDLQNAIESLPFTDDPKDNDSEIARALLQNNIVIDPETGRMKVPLLFKEGVEDLPSNLGLSTATLFSNSRSLNDYLFPGPSTVPDMASVLLRFRIGKIAISSDIEKAFLQISLEEKHRDYVRILWLKDFTKPPTRDNIMIYRYARVPFGVNCSPYLLGGSIAYHLSQVGTLIAEEIQRNIYVDNCLVFAQNVEEAISKYREIRQIFSDVKMNIREFISNSAEFNEFLEQQTGEKLPEDTKILGICWHITDDTLKIRLPDPDFLSTNTKRKCLKVLASVPDVFGLLLPIILMAKLFFQKLWKSNISWDDNIDTTDWAFATQGWKNFEYCFPRQMIQSLETNKELHIFCDASAEASAAVAYVKEYTEGQPSTTLIFAKNRIKPLNTEKNGKSSLTIPRMELIGLLIAVRMGYFLKKSLDMTFLSINIWTDSKICLQWLKNPPAKDIFVKNRIFETLEKGELYKYRHIRGIENPADVASRGCTPDQLLKHSLWWHGPPLLQHPASDYPSVTDLTSERREKPIFTLAATADTSQSIVDVSKFNSFQKLVSTMFYVFTYITLLKMKIGTVLQHPFTLFQHAQKTATNLLFIEEWLLKQLQTKYPPDLKDNKKFNIRKDENGFYRCYGRLANSDLNDQAKFPIWLPRKAALTKLIIDQIHRTHLHSGTRTTLTKLREKYWIGQGRRTIENQINKCITCKRELAKPFHQPAPPPLPKNRITQSLPFQHVGSDYLGPLTITVGGREREKRWVALFTCLATRILHLEIVENLTTARFIHALRRFIARRGQPESIISDNATTFRLAAMVENQARMLHHQDPELLDYCAHKGISWQNIPELSPWYGGAYERLVGLTKVSLQRAVGRHIPQQYEFITYLCEAEAIVNSRPLTYIQENEPIQTILRPIDF
uniref:Integrase catalytic domain-containing protein n=1 Tax=Panagrolaimus sp. ES5 TaxID=591445 RepID=A0AC34FMX0_9BILA